MVHDIIAKNILVYDVMSRNIPAFNVTSQNIPVYICLGWYNISILSNALVLEPGCSIPCYRLN